MARVLIVGCGCRGSALAGALIEQGHPARGTTRDGRGLARIEAAGAEGVVADPARLATLMRPLDGASLVVWLMGTARGGDDGVAALHGPRLEAMLELVVDTYARGFVYEAAGSVGSGLLARGAASVRRAGRTFEMPTRVVDAAPAEHERWLATMMDAVAAVLRA